MRAVLCVGCALVLIGCNEQTGSGMVAFTAWAAGPKDAVAGVPYEFDSSAGYHVRLDRAQLTIGAVYLNRSRPTLGAQETPCQLPGVYVAEVTSGVVIDALSPTRIEFEVPGRGTSDRALTAEVWLTGGRVDAANDPTKILVFSGLATRGDLAYGFHGAITISQNRAIVPSDPATPGANPLCKLRIVTPIAVDITPTDQGELTLRVMPQVWFDRIDFAQLPDASGQGEDLEIPDSSESAVANSLLVGLRAVEGYRFEWRNSR